jgi:hypothetical protein
MKQIETGRVERWVRDDAAMHPRVDGLEVVDLSRRLA